MSYSLASYHFSSHIKYHYNGPAFSDCFISPPSSTLNPLITRSRLACGCRVRVFGVSCIICASGGDSRKQRLESRSLPLLFCSLLSGRHWRFHPAHDHSFSLHPPGKRSQAIRSNEDLILRRYPSIQPDFPFSSLSSTFLFTVRIGESFLEPSTPNFELVLICCWPSPNRLISCLLFRCAAYEEVSIGFPMTLQVFLIKVCSSHLE